MRLFRGHVISKPLLLFLSKFFLTIRDTNKQTEMEWTDTWVAAADK